MLTVEQNEELTRVGPGTRMGALLRRYWYPIAFEQDFDARPSKTVRLLGEDWTLYKTPSGRYGIIAELPAPSSRAQPPPPIRLRLLRHPAALRCEVTDLSNVMPTCLATNDNAEIGRGLSLVAALSHQWGATPLPAGGKCVWADLRLPG